jgi:hypothetical protein
MCFNPSRPWNPEDGCAEMHFHAGNSSRSRASGSHEGPAGSHAGDEMRDAALGLRQDLDRRAVVVRFPVGRIVVLIGIKIAIGIGLVNLAAQPNRAVRALAWIGEHHLRAVGFSTCLRSMEAFLGRQSFTL